MRRFLSNLVRDSRTTKTAGPARRAPRRASLQVEGLEDRLVLSTAVPPHLLVPVPLQTIQAVEGRALGASGKAAGVAFFASAIKSTSNLSATINWGDGTTSQGTLVLDAAQTLRLGSRSLSLPAGLEVQGTHTYNHFGNFTIKTTVTAGTVGTQVIVTRAHVAAAPLLPLGPGQTKAQLTSSPPGQQLQAVEAVAMPQTQVASFVDTNPLGVAADHSAVINWGDGQSSTGLIKAVKGTGAQASQIDHFIVLGSHTYAQAGTFTVSVTIASTIDPLSLFGQPLVFDDAMTVKDQPLTAVPVAGFNLVEGNILPLGRVVGSFKDANPHAQASDYGPAGQSAGPGLSPGVAQVAFGDGTTGLGAVVADPTHPGVFDVLTPVTSLFHNYEEGTYHLKVTVSDRGGSQVVTDTLVHVTDAPLLQVFSLSTPSLTAFTHLPLTGTTLGFFVDGSISSPLHETDEAVSIAWGDGHTSAGHVVYEGVGIFAGVFSVVGSHTYSTVSGKTPFAIHVVVKDEGGQSLSFNTQATVLDSTTLLPGFVTNELNGLQTSIDQQIFGKALPLVGTALSKLDDGSAQHANPIDRIVGSFKQALIDGAQAAIGGDLQAVQDVIVKDIGQGVGAVLQGGVTTTSDGNGGFTAEVHLNQSSNLNTGTVALDLSLPGLPIKFATQNLAVSVQAGYDIVLDFGMHNGSPFLQTKADPSNTANPLGVALDVSAAIAPGSSISASLGGLTATLTQPSPTLFNVARGPGGALSSPRPRRQPSTPL